MAGCVCVGGVPPFSLVPFLALALGVTRAINPCLFAVLEELVMF